MDANCSRLYPHINNKHTLSKVVQSLLLLLLISIDILCMARIGWKWFTTKSIIWLQSKILRIKKSKELSINQLRFISKLAIRLWYDLSFFIEH